MENSNQSQCAMILAALERGEKLTPMDALNRFGCFRLGARAWDLRQKGHPIVSRMVEVNGKRFAQYRLEDV